MNDAKPDKLPETLYLSGTMVGPAPPGCVGFITLRWGWFVVGRIGRGGYSVHGGGIMIMLRSIVADLVVFVVVALPELAGLIVGGG